MSQRWRRLQEIGRERLGCAQAVWHHLYRGDRRWRQVQSIARPFGIDLSSARPRSPGSRSRRGEASDDLALRSFRFEGGPAYAAFALEDISLSNRWLARTRLGIGHEHIRPICQAILYSLFLRYRLLLSLSAYELPAVAIPQVAAGGTTPASSALQRQIRKQPDPSSIKGC
jgi:hypothetical protein